MIISLRKQLYFYKIQFQVGNSLVVCYVFNSSLYKTPVKVTR
jgi:hypothetical protein